MCLYDKTELCQICSINKTNSTLRCKHNFCHNCSDTLYKQHITCPLCREKSQYAL